MSKILITGNGFDLSFGLPTSYNDFIKITTFIIKKDSVNFKSIYSKTSNYQYIEKKYKEFKLEINKNHKV